MAYLRSALAAFAVFVPLLLALCLFWFAVLVGVMGGLWEGTGDGTEWIGAALLAFAVASGLALYFVLLWRRLDRIDIPPGARKWHLATTGLLPIATAAALAAVVVSSLRFGF